MAALFITYLTHTASTNLVADYIGPAQASSILDDGHRHGTGRLYVRGELTPERRFIVPAEI